MTFTEVTTQPVLVCKELLIRLQVIYLNCVASPYMQYNALYYGQPSWQCLTNQSMSIDQLTTS